jgi:hypothetical protein
MLLAQRRQKPILTDAATWWSTRQVATSHVHTVVATTGVALLQQARVDAVNNTPAAPIRSLLLRPHLATSCGSPGGRPIDARRLLHRQSVKPKSGQLPFRDWSAESKRNFASDFWYRTLGRARRIVCETRRSSNRSVCAWGNLFLGASKWSGW